MATIDLIVLGILKKEPMSAYDIQKLVEYRNISKWVKISTPSIYKKAIQLEEKGLIRGEIVKEGKMPEKVIYSLTDAGEAEFERLMFEISEKPINIFLDFNAVIVNLDSLPPEKQKSCIAEIEERLSINMEHDIKVGIVMHICFLVDKILNGNTVDRKFENLNEYRNAHSKEFILVKQSIRRIEMNYDISIGEYELANLVKMVVENSSTV